MRTRLIASAIVMTLALVASAGAQTPAPTGEPAATELTGTVLSSGNITMLVRGDDGQDRSLVVFNTTQMPDERIAAGDRVKVRYRPIDGERFEAVSLERAAGETTPGAAASAANESAGFSLPELATVSSLAWLLLAVAATIFVAAYFVSVRRHHHHHGVH
jgi:translation initiation factor IF-1